MFAYKFIVRVADKEKRWKYPLLTVHLGKWYINELRQSS